MVRQALILGDLKPRSEGANIHKLLEKLRRLNGVKEAQYITGPYDFYLIVNVNDQSEMNSVVTELREIEGIKETMTCLVLSPRT